MGYATQSDMTSRYGARNLIELTDRAEPATGEIDTAVLATALEDADALINAYVGSRYALPLNPVPAVIHAHACSIAYYMLHRDRYPDEVRKDYDDALKFLADVSQGRAMLDVAGVEHATAPADARVASPEPVFTREHLKGF